MKSHDSFQRHKSHQKKKPNPKVNHTKSISEKFFTAKFHRTVLHKYVSKVHLENKLHGFIYVLGYNWQNVSWSCLQHTFSQQQTARPPHTGQFMFPQVFIWSTIHNSVYLVFNTQFSMFCLQTDQYTVEYTFSIIQKVYILPSRYLVYKTQFPSATRFNGLHTSPNELQFMDH